MIFETCTKFNNWVREPKEPKVTVTFNSLTSLTSKKHGLHRARRNRAPFSKALGFNSQGLKT